MNGPAWAVWHLRQVSVSLARAAPPPRVELPLWTSWQSTQLTLPARTGCVCGRLNSPRLSRWHWKQTSGDLLGLTIVPCLPPDWTCRLPGPWQDSQAVSPTFTSDTMSLAWVDPAKWSVRSAWHCTHSLLPA